MKAKESAYLDEAERQAAELNARLEQELHKEERTDNDSGERKEEAATKETPGTEAVSKEGDQPEHAAVDSQSVSLPTHHHPIVQKDDEDDDSPESEAGINDETLELKLSDAPLIRRKFRVVNDDTAATPAPTTSPSASPLERAISRNTPSTDPSAGSGIGLLLSDWDNGSVLDALT